MFLFTVASFVILGIATLWANRILYGGTRDAAQHTTTLLLSCVGWLFIFMGMLFLASPVGLVIVLVVFGMTTARFRHSERRALLWCLSLAAERGIPFSPTIRAFAARRSDEMARRALALADQLDAGVTLVQALRRARIPLPPEAELFVRLSADPQTTAAALKASGRFEEDTMQAWSPMMGKVAYLMLVSVFSIFVFAFIMVKIMPTLNEIYNDFGMSLPAVTQLTIAFSNWCAQYWYFFLPIGAYIVGSVLTGAFFYSQGRVWLPPPFPRWFGPTDKPTIFRALAICVDQQLPIPEALRRVARDYPSPRIQQQLAECAGATAVGADWCEVMHSQGLITRAEVAVLKSASQAGNLTWGLRELAEVASRRVLYRANWVVNIASAVSILLLSLPVALLALGCFVPLVGLIQSLS